MGDEIKKLPLTVAMICTIEKIACSTDPARQQDAVFCGFFRFCIAGRIRIADAVRIIDEPYISESPGQAGDFVESKLRGARYKTGHGARKRRHTLPVAAPCAHILYPEWARSWIRLRYKLGMNASEDRTLMRAPNDDGSFF